MDHLTLLKKIVSINSVFPNERKAGEFLERCLKARGFRTRRVHLPDGRFNIVGERGTRGKPLLLFGHYDTVPPYGYNGNPWKPTENGDELHGLGAFDMKAGCAAILAATEERGNRRIRVAFSADEENISEGSYRLAKAGVFRGVDAVLSTEISTSVPCEGLGEIVLGRRGRCVIEITVPGRSAHGAQVHRGISAISEAGRLVLALERMNGKLGKHPLLPPPTQFVRKIHGESTSLSIPDTAVVELDRHMVVPETPQSVLRQVQKFIAALYRSGAFRAIDGKRITARLAARPNPFLEPYVTPQNDRHVKLLTNIVKEKTGRKPKYTYGLSVADDNRLASAGVAVISLGPMGGGEHTHNEWVSKKSYLQLVEIVREFIRRS
ncbi:[LysW]-lysine/[LysW]-ornithine hydrolase [uncultured archaeon]|nr:[LysW]-lysine/[LysW]-ornithine hydrolase [uncultured archaeon]